MKKCKHIRNSIIPLIKWLELIFQYTDLRKFKSNSDPNYIVLVTISDHHINSFFDDLRSSCLVIIDRLIQFLQELLQKS